jgi:hypothetical protein
MALTRLEFSSDPIVDPLFLCQRPEANVIKLFTAIIYKSLLKACKNGLGTLAKDKHHSSLRKIVNYGQNNL